MIWERITCKKLELKVGDWLTFYDNTTRVQVKSIQKRSLIVSVPNSIKFTINERCHHTSPLRLSSMTERLMPNTVQSMRSCLNLWWLDGQTLRQRYTANMAREFEKMKVSPCPHVYDPPRSAWLQDIRNTGNLFYTETWFRFLRNFFLYNSFTISDQDIFHQICVAMTQEKMLSLFYDTTTKTIRKDLASREYSYIFDPRIEEPMDLLIALYRNPQSNPKFRYKLVEWLDYAQEVIAGWQKENPDPAKKKNELVKQHFDLSPLEHDILLLSLLCHHDVFRCSDFNWFTDWHPTNRKFLTRHSLIRRAALLGINEAEYKNATQKGSRLRRQRCLCADLKLNKRLGLT